MCFLRHIYAFSSSYKTLFLLVPCKRYCAYQMIVFIFVQYLYMSLIVSKTIEVIFSMYCIMLLDLQMSCNFGRSKQECQGETFLKNSFERQFFGDANMLYFKQLFLDSDCKNGFKSSYVFFNWKCLAFFSLFQNWHFMPCHMNSSSWMFLLSRYFTGIFLYQDGPPGTSFSEWSILFVQICHTIETELGKSMDELFSDFVKTPLATASVRSSNYCW